MKSSFKVLSFELNFAIAAGGCNGSPELSRDSLSCVKIPTTGISVNTILETVMIELSKKCSTAC